MFKFNQEVIYTGQEDKISKKGNQYKIINMLDENGRQFSCMAEPEAYIPDTLNQLDRVDVTFKLVVGRYLSLSILGMEVSDAYSR